MANLRTTVILKTDIVDSTPRVAGQTQAEMGLQRKQHKQFITEIAIKNLGTIFQEEGDAYWIEFPSVTTAVLAAIEMHQNLRSQQAGKGEKRRLAIRAVITVGDILHQEHDSIGTTMNLTARIEKVTPPDEIYLSHAAWLVLNKAEVQTSLVNEFNFKGFQEPEKIYKVEQKHRTRVILDQYIVFVGVRGWTSFTKSEEVQEIERFLSEYDDLINELCDKYGGVVRNTLGDEYLLTFSEANPMLIAIEKLCRNWNTMIERYKLGLSVAIHKGNINVLRSYLFGDNIVTVVYMQQLNSLVQSARDKISVAASGKIKDGATGTDWEQKFQDLDKDKIAEIIGDSRFRTLVKEQRVYSFIVEDD